MTFLSALIAWLVLAAVLVTALVLATKGTIWLLLVCLIAFFFAFSKWGCATH
ncbi:MAG TPA: hypothetical protein VNH84_21295 [Candidatus Saccharimonadales bacterium]|jgi:hypothetical protein|nr:hypothetical protein [Candidatus Saccharimonadales bacterium]